MTIPPQLLQLLSLSLHHALVLHDWYPSLRSAQQTVPPEVGSGVGAGGTGGAVGLAVGLRVGDKVGSWVAGPQHTSPGYPLPAL